MEINYKIIGGDGREYGAVTLDELKGWVRDGRVGRQTQVLRSDLGNWLAAAQYQELQFEIGTLPASSAEFTDNLEPVGFWPRFGAIIVDSILLYIVFALISKAMGWQLIIQPTPGQRIEDLMPILMTSAKHSLISIVIRMLYEVLMTGAFGATIGKMIIGAKIVRLDGSPLGYGFAFLRFLGKIVSDLTCSIGYLIVAFREDKRGLHDLIAKTRVVYKR